jgi:hypothetical protein
VEAPDEAEAEPFAPWSLALAASAFALASASILLTSGRMEAEAPLVTGRGEPSLDRDFFWELSCSSSGCGLFSRLLAVSAMIARMKRNTHQCYSLMSFIGSVVNVEMMSLLRGELCGIQIIHEADNGGWKSLAPNYGVTYSHIL